MSYSLNNSSNQGRRERKDSINEVIDLDSPATHATSYNDNQHGFGLVDVDVKGPNLVKHTSKEFRDYLILISHRYQSEAYL
jgi:hypothetical protein